jgi:hypothetical protein
MKGQASRAAVRGKAMDTNGLTLPENLKRHDARWRWPEHD